MIQTTINSILFIILIYYVILLFKPKIIKEGTITIILPDGTSSKYVLHGRYELHTEVYAEITKTNISVYTVTESYTDKNNVNHPKTTTVASYNNYKSYELSL